MLDLSKIALMRREDALLESLGLSRSVDGTIHQIDLMEAIIKRIEALERKSKQPH